MKKVFTVMVILSLTMFGFYGCIDFSKIKESENKDKELKANNHQIDTSLQCWIQFNKAQEIIGMCPDSIRSVSGHGQHYNDNGPGLSGYSELLIDEKDSSLYITIEEATNKGWKIFDAVRIKGIRTRPILNSVRGFSKEGQTFKVIRDYDSKKLNTELTFFMDYKNKKIVKVKNKNI
jgi:hypothetical protein